MKRPAWFSCQFAFLDPLLIRLSDAEFKAYWRLFSTATYSDGKIRNTEKDLERISGMPAKDVLQMIHEYDDLFEIDGMDIVVTQAVTVLAEYEKFTTQRQSAGRKGADARWNKGLKVVSGGGADD